MVLAISGPSMIIAFLKLRQRTLGPVLEGNGWAINGRVKINIPLGASLTGAKKLPANSRRMLNDPFEDKAAKTRNRWIVAITIAFVLLCAAASWYHAEVYAWWTNLINPTPDAPVAVVTPPAAAK